ncbi:MoaD family protein [Methanotrichaceae archaeon M04Ac]|jgi:molybdopterin synthase sulfur carrier subunit|uniref:MoaD family protein n=1 Tax=Candidatus Methanocrinis alkalitolerans TaxID=3033395 RepID=A0ABT5XEJ7_9EURY|nr:ubiquitin-like small modifier protein 1 [Candidatus Methanocrinis alkalitolerans]MDF0593139.1 MoaD family protein [Candidatus Methanocrinis alkalitolerans]
MLIHVRAFASFREILGKETDLDLEEASKVGDLLEILVSSHQGLGPAIFEEDGRVREYVIIMRNRERIDSLEGLATVLEEGDEVAILPPVAGG